jgi:hypothetical protein
LPKERIELGQLEMRAKHDVSAICDLLQRALPMKKLNRVVGESRLTPDVR